MANIDTFKIPDSLFSREEISISDIQEIIPDGHMFSIGEVCNIFSTMCTQQVNKQVGWKVLSIKGGSSFQELSDGVQHASRLHEWGEKGRMGLTNLIQSDLLASLNSLTIEGLSDFGDEDVCHLGEYLKSGKMGFLRNFCLSNVVLRNVDKKEAKQRRRRDEGIGLKAATALASWLQSSQAEALECLAIIDTDMSAMALQVVVKSFEGGRMRNLSDLKLSTCPFGRKISQYSMVAVAEELCRSLVAGNVSGLRNLALRSDSDPGDLAGPFCSLVTCPCLQALESLSITGISLSAKLGSKDWKSQKASTDMTGATFSSNELHSLKILELEGDFSDETIVTLFSSMEAGQFDTLQKLSIKDISWMIANKTRAMADCLAAGKARNLRDLLIHFRADGDVHQMRLAEACVEAELPNLETMNFGSPCFSEKSLLKIALALEVGKLPSLKKFVLFTGDQSRLSQDVQRAFTSAFKRNKFLTACLHEDLAESHDPLMSPADHFDFFKSLRELQLSNEKQVQVLKALQDQPYVSGTYGKVFLCGNPRVGKTTLQRTLQRQPTWKSYLKFISCCFKPREFEEVPTRGIEVDHMKILAEANEQELELAFWDLAGQHEYEVLHSAFLPDLALADGRATFFIIVCSANADNASNVETARDALLYWLRFIASNSQKGVGKELRRQVLVVLNCFGGQHAGHDLQQWNSILADCQENFQDFLNLHSWPFILDVQHERETMHLRKHLQQEARKILKHRQVPQICADILQSCKEWVARQRETKYFVVPWHHYRAHIAGAHLPEDLLRAATIYLHEGGHLILFKDLTRSDHFKQMDEFGAQSVLILDPEWFCERVIGHLLLPDCLLHLGETSLPSRYMGEDGSLPLAVVQRDRFEISEEKFDEMLKILVRLGLGYTLTGDSQRIFVPALIKDDHIPEWFAQPGPFGSRGEASSWVMGFSLSSQDSLRTLLPVAVFRKLQVHLAQDRNVGRRADSEFRAGVSRISCKWNGNGVIVEYYGNPHNSQNNRIDILVRPIVPRGQLSEDECRHERENQVQRAQFVANLTLNLAAECSPGLEMKRSVIRPWMCANGFVPLQKRDVSFSVEEMTEQLHNGIVETMGYNENAAQFATNWDVGGKLVKFRDVLGADDWGSVASIFEEGHKGTELALDTLQIIPTSGPSLLEEGNVVICKTSISDESEPQPENKIQLQPHEMQLIDHLSNQLDNRLVPRLVQLDSSLSRLDQINKKFNTATERLSNVLKLKASLNTQIQTLETFSVMHEDNSVPRFVYLTSKQGNWITVRDTYSEQKFLHFWCEAGSGDSKMHEVKGQEGVDIRQLRDWAKKLAPILIWSLKIAYVTAMVAGSAILPGFGLLLPNVSNNVVQNGALMADGMSDLLNLCAKSFVKDGAGNQVEPADQPECQSKQRELRGAARSYVKELLGKLTSTEFEKKVGLFKVRILDEDGMMRKVVWVCRECHKKLVHQLQAHELIQ